MVMMFVVGRLSAKIQPKYLIAVGAVLIALSMYDMTNVYGDFDFWFMVRSRMLLGVGLPLTFYWLRVLILGAWRNIPSAVWTREIPGVRPPPSEIGCSVNPGRSAVG
jgi:hypothetical protein